jgi:hypothetical protein
MKMIAYVVFALLIMGCSHKPKTTQEILTKIEKVPKTMLTNEQRVKKEADFADLRKFKNVFSIESLITILKRYNYRYKIVCVDTRNWTRNKRDILKTRRVILKFGRNLGKKAIIANLIYKTSRKRDYVRRVSQKLSSYYNLDTQAPFLIFYKGNENNKYVPYKIVSIASMSKYQLNRSLLLLTKAINSGKSSKQIYATLERITAKMYSYNYGVRDE